MTDIDQVNYPTPEGGGLQLSASAAAFSPGQLPNLAHLSTGWLTAARLRVSARNRRVSIYEKKVQVKGLQLSALANSSGPLNGAGLLDRFL